MAPTAADVPPITFRLSFYRKVGFSPGLAGNSACRGEPEHIMQTVDEYRAAWQPLPKQIKRWHLTGAGSGSLHEVTVEMPSFGPDELLVRHDACGICFSDIKIIDLGPEHPRLADRDMAAEPVVMGHEVALTVVGVGSDLRGHYEIGQRFIIQVDVYYQGKSLTYGYQLSGGMAEYGVITRQVLEGDEGCYLLPIAETTGYAEAALVEPWACVVAAYAYPNYRGGPLKGGRMLSVDADASTASPNAHEGTLYDDIVIYGTPDADTLAQLLSRLAPRGTLNLVSDKMLTGMIPIDVGRVHYEQHLFVGISSRDAWTDAYASNTRSELLPGGNAWFVGAGGPLGQMHLQRAILLDNPPHTIVVTDQHPDRLAHIQTRFEKPLAARNITLILLNPDEGGDVTEFGPFDDIVNLVPSAALISESLPHLAENGVYNIFAGLAKGSMALVDLGMLLRKNQRLIGTSGSSIADLRHTLELVENDRLSTNSSLAAIGGLDAFRDGLAAVKAGQFPGKTVIFPHLKDLPLLSLEDLRVQIPTVYALLDDGNWTSAAEAELFQEKLGLPHATAQ